MKMAAEVLGSRVTFYVCLFWLRMMMHHRSTLWLKMAGADLVATTLFEFEGAIENHTISLWWLVTDHLGSLKWHLRRILPACQFTPTAKHTLYDILRDNYGVWTQSLRNYGLTAEQHLGKSRQSARSQ